MKPVARFSAFLAGAPLRSIAVALVSLHLAMPASAATLDDLLNATKLGDAGEVAAFLAEHCGEDPVLRARVERLLASRTAADRRNPSKTSHSAITPA